MSLTWHYSDVGRDRNDCAVRFAVLVRLTDAASPCARLRLTAHSSGAQYLVASDSGPCRKPTCVV